MDDQWYLVDVYRNAEIPQAEYNAFKAEVRQTSLRMMKLSIDGVIFDSTTYPDLEDLETPVLDVRILEESGLAVVKNILDGKKYLRYDVRNMEYSDD